MKSIRTLHLASVALVVTAVFMAAPVHAQWPRDRLWALVESCLDPARPAPGSQCPAPRADGVENQSPNCRTTTQVWAQSQQFVAIRDLRMCNCPADFVHGLAIPLARITGIEAANLPEGIWKFAWDAASTKIDDDEDAIALVVNPPSRRTQDQLHIHLVRRRTGVCQKFPAGATLLVPTLDHVWQRIKERAQEQHFTNYGALVTRCAKDSFTILVEPESGSQSPEKRYTEHDCH